MCFYNLAVPSYVHAKSHTLFNACIGVLKDNIFRDHMAASGREGPLYRDRERNASSQGMSN